MIKARGHRSNVYLYSGDVVNSGKVVPLNSMPEVRDIFGDEWCATENVLCSKRVTINGLSYGKGTVLLQRIESDVNFVKVFHVVVHEQAKYLYSKNLKVKYFDAHLNAFVVEDLTHTA